jgi:menaquinone-dependent protoporphyrinogen oxidase
VARFAIAYASSEGQTRAVVDHLALALREFGHGVSVDDVVTAAAGASVTASEAVVVAGSIHGGRLQPALVRFASGHGVALSERPSALIIVSLSAAAPEPLRSERLDEYLTTFLASTPWRPDVAEFVAGALRPSTLGSIRRSLASRMVRQLGLPTDVDLECTDWDGVRRFADSLARWFPRVGVPIRAPGRSRHGEPEIA